MGVLPGHAPLLSALGAGVLTYDGGSGKQVLVIDGGFCRSVRQSRAGAGGQRRVRRDIEPDAARRELDEANQALKNAHDTPESEAALRAMQRAQARLDAAERR